MSEFNAESVEKMLMDALYGWPDDLLGAVEADECRTYEEAGVLTQNNGLVLRMTDGTEFQVTVVRSR